MRQEFQRAFVECRKAHENAVKAEAELRTIVMSTPDEGELADGAYALRECNALLDDAASRLRATGKLAEKMAGLVAATSMVETIRTSYVTATPRPHLRASVPSRKKDPQKWKELMLEVGMPEALLGPQDEDGSPAVDIYWPGFMALLSKRLAEGQPLPKGIDPVKTVTEYSLILHKKKGVTE